MGREALPFVDSRGIVGGALQWRDVLALLGEPDESTLFDDGSVVQAYRALGLRFRVERGARDAQRAQVLWMHVVAPCAAATPQGLHLGMAQPAALALLAQAYRAEDATPPTGGAEWTASGRSRGPGAPRQVRLRFRDGTLQEMVFELQDRSLAGTLARHHVTAPGVALAAAVLGIAAAVAWRRRARPPAAAAAARPLPARAPGAEPRPAPARAAAPAPVARPAMPPAPSPASALAPAPRRKRRPAPRDEPPGVVLPLVLMAVGGLLMGWAFFFGPRGSYDGYLTLFALAGGIGLAVLGFLRFVEVQLMALRVGGFFVAAGVIVAYLVIRRVFG